jgi:hypothetical protein
MCRQCFIRWAEQERVRVLRFGDARSALANVAAPAGAATGDVAARQARILGRRKVGR